MKTIDFDNAYYIKLGRGGKWEESSIRQGRLRIGWGQQSLDDINRGNWARIGRQLRKETEDTGAATRDLNALKSICQSTEEDVWITFHGSCLWWCRPGRKLIRKDRMSKFRKTADGWSDKDIHGNMLHISRISGKLSKIQGFRGTACQVNEKAVLRRLLNDQPSDASRSMKARRSDLIASVEQGLRELHWKDFEILIDLIFRQSGWRRVSVLGETMKGIDMVLMDPINRDIYQVQVKSSATAADFNDYAAAAGGGCRRIFFVVHSPDLSLVPMAAQSSERIELWLPSRIAEMTVDLGLVEWVMNRIL